MFLTLKKTKKITFVFGGIFALLHEYFV
jgi:hypothetical protein